MKTTANYLLYSTAAAPSSGCRRRPPAPARSSPYCPRGALPPPPGRHVAPLGRSTSAGRGRRALAVSAQRRPADGDGRRGRVYGDRAEDWDDGRGGMPPPPPPPPPPRPGSGRGRPTLGGVSLPSGKAWQAAGLLLQASVRLFLIFAIFATAIYLADTTSHFNP